MKTQKNMERARFEDYRKAFRVERDGPHFVIVDSDAELVADFFCADDAAQIACDALNKAGGRR